MNLREFKNSKRGLWVGRGLIAIGTIITLCLVYFNGKHGWSLGRSWDEQVALAILHGAVDPVTALLVSSAAIAIAWHYRWTGVAICVVALVFTSYSMLTTAGFMANRLADVFGQKAALAELDKQGKWWSSTTYNRDLSRGEKLANRAELRATFKEKVKVASQVHDPQAMWIAGMLSVTMESAQRGLNLISSGIGQAMKYMALLVGFFLLSNRDEQAVSEPANHKNSGGSDGSGGSGGGEPRKKPDLKPVPKAEPTPLRAEPSKQRSAFGVPTTGAPERLERLSAFDRAWAVADQHPFLSTRQIADRARVSQSTGARVQKRLRGKADRIIRKMGNGRGYQTPAYN